MRGEPILAPISGLVIREAIPYKDSLLSGVVIQGSEEYGGIDVKLFYVGGLYCGAVRAGDVIGHAQDLTVRYPGITNHVHLEVYIRGMATSPFDAYKMCF